MSSIKLESNVSGSGVFTIASPNSNTNRTLTLPDNTGTILTSATTTGFPAGSVLQVISGTFNTQTNFTTTSMTDSGLSASITPTSSSSKVLVFVNLSSLRILDAINSINFQLLRGSTVINGGGQYNGYWVNGTSNAVTQIVFPTKTMLYLDSPATTSSTTYKVQCAARTASTTVTLNLNDGGDAAAGSTIILMEIAA